VEEIVVRWGLLVGDLIMRWWWGVGIGLMMDMVEQGFISLHLLVKNIDSILQFYKPRSLPTDMLSVRFDVLGYNLPSHDGLLLLLVPLNFLLDSD
jgi:hypothetical protein